ncbi:MAG: YdcF family protein [Casimicrobiaceae bacterium]
MIDPTWVKAVLKTLVLPPTGPLLLALVGLGVWRRFPRGAHVLAWTGVLLLWVLSMPVVAAFLVRSLDTSPPLEMARAAEAKALVILGGGVRRNAAEYGGDTLATLTLERVRYGARVARATHLPILVTGGTVLAGEPEAKLMREVLEREYGLQVRWAEDRSRNTHENALRSAEILRAAGIERVVLVAHSFDIPRAKAEFAAAGIEIIAAPTGIPATGSDTFLDYLPGIGGLHTSYYAIYEILANLVRLIRPAS